MTKTGVAIVLSILLLPFLFHPVNRARAEVSKGPTTPTVELVRTLHEGSNFKPYPDQKSWESRANYLRQQTQISAGLWPMPERTPLNAVIHGKIDREDYTIEKVYFESHPGFYVTGNLYRPKNRTGPFPAVLSPHGHWTNGRLYEAPDKEFQKQLAGGWEKTMEGASYPMQARCAHLAKLGCIVFFYDMIGFADSDSEKFPHKNSFLDMESNIHGLNIFGQQTWNSIRALDFLESLSDVDKSRLAITGASGGATQTVAMMAIDPRLIAAAPVNMISAGEHQGGCVCENNPLLRVGTDNVELAATFAPKPFIAPSATGDWTNHFPEQGFPELQSTYALFKTKDYVESFHQDAPHNYNQNSREAVYNFFNKHLKLGHAGVLKEKHFTPVKPADLSVWNADHPRPKNAIDQKGLLEYWKQITEKQMAGLVPENAQGVEKAQAILRPALVHMLAGLPDAPVAIGKATYLALDNKDDIVNQWLTLTLPNGTHVEANCFHTKDLADPLGSKNGVIVMVETSLTHDNWNTQWQLAKSTGKTVIVPSLYGVANPVTRITPANPKKPEVNLPIEFYACYNPSGVARQISNLITLIKSADLKNITLISTAESHDSAIVALLTRALISDRIHSGMVNWSATKPGLPKSELDLNYLPLIERYGIWPLASIGGNSPLKLYSSTDAIEKSDWLIASFKFAGAEKNLQFISNTNSNDAMKLLIGK